MGFSCVSAYLGIWGLSDQHEYTIADSHWKELLVLNNISGALSWLPATVNRKLPTQVPKVGDGGFGCDTNMNPFPEPKL